MKVRFTKMHGLGNDFVIMDGISFPVKLKKNQIEAMGNRNTGIGFDQLLMVEPPRSPDADFFYRIFNQDGSEAEQCGNGARCFARFVTDQCLTYKKEIKLETVSGMITCRLEDGGLVSVDMGSPIFDPARIPCAAKRQAKQYTVHLKNGEEKLSALSMGNPHGVVLVPDVAEIDIKTRGKILSHHRFFPKRANIGFLQIVTRNKAKLHVYERGVGPTQACGTAACAAIVVGRTLGLLEQVAFIEQPGGTLRLEWSGRDDSVWMTGPAEKIYEGKIAI